MKLLNQMLAGAGVFQTVIAQADIPLIKTNLAKDGNPAQWAAGHPKVWGSEDFQMSLGVPSPEQDLDVVATEDEKFLVISNGTHVQFLDLDTNSTVALLYLPQEQWPQREGAMLGNNLYRAGDLKVHTAAQGGYNVIFTLFDGREYDLYGSKHIHRLRVGANLQLLGSSVYQSGVGAVSSRGSLAALSGKLYDLSRVDTDTPYGELTGGWQSGISFSADGALLASSANLREAHLRNVTSGEKILSYPRSGSDDIYTRGAYISPDGEYVVVAQEPYPGAGLFQVYPAADPTSKPIEIQLMDHGHARDIAWHPSKSQVAVGDKGRLRILDVPSMKVVNVWETDVRETVGLFHFAPTQIKWLDGGNKITWVWRWGRYMYDFETNTAWLWTHRRTDRLWGVSNIALLKKKGYAVTADGDSRVRWWKM